MLLVVGAMHSSIAALFSPHGYEMLGYAVFILHILVLPSILDYLADKSTLVNSVLFLSGVALWFTGLQYHVAMYDAIYIASTDVLGTALFAYTWGLLPFLMLVLLIIGLLRNERFRKDINGYF